MVAADVVPDPAAEPLLEEETAVLHQEDVLIAVPLLHVVDVLDLILVPLLHVVVILAIVIKV